MCFLAVVVVLILLFIAWSCLRKPESFGRGGPMFDFLPTVGEVPTGEGGYVDEEAIPS